MNIPENYFVYTCEYLCPYLVKSQFMVAHSKIPLKFNILVNPNQRYSSYFGKVKTYVDSTCYVEAVSVYFMLGNKF